MVELDPPFDVNDTKLMEGAALLRDINVDMITLADSPLARPRADSIASAIKMRYTRQMEAMPHICCRDKNMIAHRSPASGNADERAAACTDRNRGSDCQR